jgi:hypothetical protein
MRALLPCLLLLMCFPAAAQDAKPAPADEEAVLTQMKQLDFLVGTWEGDEKWWMGPGEPTIVKAHTTSTMEAGGRFLVTRYEEKGTPLGDMSGVSVITYDSSDKIYKLWDFTAYSQGTLGKGSFEGDIFVVAMDTEGGGQKMKLRFFYKKLSQSEYELKIDVSLDEGKTWLKSFEAVFHKTGQ